MAANKNNEVKIKMYQGIYDKLFEKDKPTISYNLFDKDYF